jgi:D-aminopeptidase
MFCERNQSLNYSSMFVIFFIFLKTIGAAESEKHRIRDYGVKIGIYDTGKNNSITDVKGVAVGHITLMKDLDVRTGVTAIVPHGNNLFQEKVPAAIYIANGFGKLTGYSQVEELGNLETPIILTNTLSVPTAADALIDYTLSIDENKSIRSINPVVGETNDGSLNNIQRRYIKKEHVLQAIEKASVENNEEGNVGAGTGTICFGYKGGIGTSSRILPEIDGGYAVGVLVQTNFGGDLTIAGIPVGRELQKNKKTSNGDGSCMIVVATDAPIKARNLKRLAKRAMLGLARTGGNSSNGSGDYVIAFSVSEELRMIYKQGEEFLEGSKEVRNDRMTPLFQALAEATEEAILNSLFAASTMTGWNNLKIDSLPVQETVDLLKTHHIIK